MSSAATPSSRRARANAPPRRAPSNPPPRRPTPSRARPPMTSTPTVSRVITKEELCLMEKVPESCGIIIFGASGDLTHRKLMPALFSLTLENVLPKQFYVLGVARSPLTDAQFQSRIKEG